MSASRFIALLHTYMNIGVASHTLFPLRSIPRPRAISVENSCPHFEHYSSLTMEPPTTLQPHPAFDMEPARGLSRREKYEAIASSSACCLRVANSILWGTICLAYRFAVIIWGDLRLFLTAALRIVARHADAIADALDSAHERSRGQIIRPAIEANTEESTSVISRESEVGESVEDEITAEDSIGEYDGFDFHDQQVIQRYQNGDVHATILTKRRRGRARIRALREKRRLIGLKV